MSHYHIGKRKKIKALLTLAFALSFSEYFFPLNNLILAVPVLLLGLTGYLGIILSTPVKFGQISAYLFRPKSLLFTLALPLIPTVASLFSGNTYSAIYGCLMISSLLAICIILCIVSIRDIILSYFYASVFCTILFLALSVKGLLDSIEGDYRFIVFSFHPNLIAFIVAGFIPVHFWRYRNSAGAKFWLLILIFVDSVLIFYSSSRGSIVAVLVGIVTISVIRFSKMGRSVTLSAIVKPLFLGLFISVLVLTVLIISPKMANKTSAYVADKLQLYSEYRGLNSGLSGRVERWNITLDALKRGTWLLGNGYRSGSRELGFSIDNGYLTLVYEMGIVPAIFIILKYIWVTLCCGFRYLRAETSENEKIYLTLVFIMVVFLTNNIVARYLFGLGNPSSLLALFFLVVSGNEIGAERGTLLRSMSNRRHERSPAVS